jgi:hypothetical protein
MGNILIKYSGTNVNQYFQTYDAGNTGGVVQQPTNVNWVGNDISISLSPRDNKSSNAAVATGAIIARGTDIGLIYNKTGATIDFTVGGTAVFTGSVINTGMTYSAQSPTANGTLPAPFNATSFTVPNPTVDASNNCTRIGSYGGPFTTVSSPPTTTYYTVKSQIVGGGNLFLKLPGNYAPGTISGAFSIVPSGTLVRPSSFVASMVSGTGPAEWVSSILASPPESSITDVNYGDTTTYSFVDSSGAPDFSNYTTTGTISFSSQSYTSTATMYIQLGLTSVPWGGIGPTPIATGSLEYTTNGGTTWTTYLTWTTSTNPSSFSGVNTNFGLPIGSNLNQMSVRITTQQSFLAVTHVASIYPRIYDIYIAYAP